MSSPTQSPSKPKWTPTNLMYSVMGGICLLIGLYFLFWWVIYLYALFVERPGGEGVMIILPFGIYPINYLTLCWFLLGRSIKLFVIIFQLIFVLLRVTFFAFEILEPSRNGSADTLIVFDVILFFSLRFLYLQGLRSNKAPLKA